MWPSKRKLEQLIAQQVEEHFTRVYKLGKMMAETEARNRQLCLEDLIVCFGEQTREEKKKLAELTPMPKCIEDFLREKR